MNQVGCRPIGCRLASHRFPPHMHMQTFPLQSALTLAVNESGADTDIEVAQKSLQLLGKFCNLLAYYHLVSTMADYYSGRQELAQPNANSSLQNASGPLPASENGAPSSSKVNSTTVDLREILKQNVVDSCKWVCSFFFSFFSWHQCSGDSL